jgi:hypothetical protein
MMMKRLILAAAASLGGIVFALTGCNAADAERYRYQIDEVINVPEHSLACSTHDELAGIFRHLHDEDQAELNAYAERCGILPTGRWRVVERGEESWAYCVVDPKVLLIDAEGCLWTAMMPKKKP